MDVNYAGYGYHNHGNYQNRQYGGGNCQYRDQNRGGYFYYGDQQNRRSRYEEEDMSLKDLMKEVIRVQNVENESVENSLKVLNDRIDQWSRNDQASLQDLERRFEQMNERVANQSTGQIPSNIQTNFRSSNDQSGQGSRYETFYQRNEQLNAIYTRSGFNYGQEEERNGNKNETGAELGTTAPQSTPLRRSGSTDFFPVVANQSSAPQFYPMRCSEPVSDSDEDEEIEMEQILEKEPMVSNANEKEGKEENDPQAELEVEDQVGDEPEFEIEVEAPKQAENIIEHPVIKVYKPRVMYPQRLLQEKMKASYGLDKFFESDDSFNELDELIMKEDLEECEDKKEVVEEEEELDEEQKEKSLDVELEEFLGMSMEEAGNRDSNDYGNITLEEIERMFDLSTEPIATKKENENGGEKCLGTEMEVEKETREELDGELCSKVKVDKDSLPKLKGISNKLIDLFVFLTCLKKEEVLQGIDDNEDEPLNFDDFTYGKPIERDKYGGEEGALKQWKDSMIMRETKEWHDAMAKTRMELDVSNYVIMFDLICFVGTLKKSD